MYTKTNQGERLTEILQLSKNVFGETVSTKKLDFGESSKATLAKVTTCSKR